VSLIKHEALHATDFFFQVLQLIDEQIQKVDQKIDALLLVGGFAGNNYLKQRVEVRCEGLPCFNFFRSDPNKCVSGKVFVKNTGHCEAP